VKKRLVENNRSSAASSKTEAAFNKPGAPQRRQITTGSLWFADLDEAEYEPCFWHEIRRERLPRSRLRIMQHVVEIDNSSEDENEKFRQKLELQQELDELKRGERAWVDLTNPEKRALMESTDWDEPVRSVKEMSRWERRRPSAAQEVIALSIDFRETNEALMASFQRLLTKMRDGGKAKFEKRGRPVSVKLRLFSLSVYRCLREGMKPNEAWKYLAPLRDKFWIGEHNSEKLIELAGDIEREIGSLPS
jgi:hypothetical protein